MTHSSTQKYLIIGNKDAGIQLLKDEFNRLGVKDAKFYKTLVGAYAELDEGQKQSLKKKGYVVEPNGKRHI